MRFTALIVLAAFAIGTVLLGALSTLTLAALLILGLASAFITKGKIQSERPREDSSIVFLKDRDFWPPQPLRHGGTELSDFEKTESAA